MSWFKGKFHLMFILLLWFFSYTSSRHGLVFLQNSQKEYKKLLER